MGQRRYVFGDWKPDLPAIANDGLTRARNVLPTTAGYGPMPSFVAISALAALTDPSADPRVRGAAAFIDNAGTPHNFAGTQAKLWHLYGGGTEDATRLVGGDYNCADAERWEFAAFGGAVIAVNRNDVPQIFDLPSGFDFRKLADGAPQAAHIGVVGSHVVLGNLYDVLFGSVPDSIWFSAIGNALNWPEPGSDEAVQVQSDRQILEGDGGWCQRVISGAEVGAIFQERAIWRMDYVGGDIIFQLTKVEPARGLLAPGLAVAVGRFVFYCAEDGFYLFDYTGSKPIGKDRTNAFFLADVDRTYLDRVSSITDPDTTRIYVLYPGAGNVGGQPNKLLVYDWVLDRFTEGELTADFLTHSLQPGVTLDTPPFANLDAPPPEWPSLDARQSQVGALTLGAFNASRQIGSLTGSALAGVLETGDLELNPGMRSLVTSCRPLVRGAIPSVQVAALGEYQASVVYGRSAKARMNGEANLRSNGRYHRFRVSLPAGFDEAVGMDVMSIQAGSQ